VPGPTGPPGPAGAIDASRITRRIGPTVNIAANANQVNLSVVCAASEVAIAGGFQSDVGAVYISRPSSNGLGWDVFLDNQDYPAGTGNGFVVCVRV
jgi:hypothetical protein